MDEQATVEAVAGFISYLRTFVGISMSFTSLLRVWIRYSDGANYVRSLDQLKQLVEWLRTKADEECLAVLKERLTLGSSSSASWGEEIMLSRNTFEALGLVGDQSSVEH